MIDEPPLTAAEMSQGGSVTGVPGGIPGGTGYATTLVTIPEVAAVAPPAPPPAAKPATPKIIRLRVGGQVQEALLIQRVIPTYPPLARQARVAGVVQLLGIVGTDGHIRELHVIAGHPLLVRAALDAVQQWVYRPTLLNDDPVEVIAPITVTFKLN